MAAEARNAGVQLASKPEGRLTRSNFRMLDTAMPRPSDGEVLVRVILISIDAANRAWMQSNVGYRQGVRPGDIMAGNGVGVVIESKSPDVTPGELVSGDLGWRQFMTAVPGKLRRIAPVAPLSRRLSLLGVAGKTAYHGLFTIGAIQRGETVLISAAGGSIGTLAGQIAKHHGCRVIGVAGGGEKCEWLTAECGYDAAVDHRAPDFRQSLRAACPEGINVYFDNVGGAVLENALRLMQRKGRIVCCGAASQYDADIPTGPRGVPGILAANSLRMEGFLVYDHADQDQAVEDQLARWERGGALRAVEEIWDGLASAPEALIRLLAGRSRGKVMVRVSSDPLA